MLKICSECKRELPIENFSLRKRVNKNSIKYSPLSLCKKCNVEKSKAYYSSVKGKRIYFVYRFLDSDNNVLYVGKTETLNYRIRTHFTKGHLPKECYNSVAKIEYLTMKSIIMMDIREIYYINLYKPEYNSNHIVNEPAITIKDFATDKWEEYNKEHINELERKDITDKFTTCSEGISSIFYRKRNNRYLVYMEYKLSKNINKNKYNKKQVLKGSFDKEVDAINYLEKLKHIYSFKI